MISAPAGWKSADPAAIFAALRQPNDPEKQQ